MRLTTVVLIASLMQLSAATFGQRISLDRQNTSLKSVLREMTRQSGFGFFYDGKVIGDNQKVDVKLTNVELDEALRRVLSGLKLSYTIDGKIVSIKKLEEPSFFENLVTRFRAIDVRGRVLDENGQPLVGATVAVKGKNRSVKTDLNGEFFLEGVGENDRLVISFIGYSTREVDATAELDQLLMTLQDSELEEVKISTGYQTIDQSKITGSVAVVDNQLLNRAVSPDLLSRLKGVTNGLLMGNSLTTGNSLGISIRGRSTLFSGTSPLIVVDNFPFEGNLNTINPNDIEDVVLLKDAAAASIWGVRAGNGVLVITTKKGKFSETISASANANLTIGEKPDLFYQPQISSADFIEIEKFLFNKGKFRAPLRNNFALISPVVALLSQRNAGNASQIDEQIESFKQYDSREQIRKYFYQNSLNQQYHFSVGGGGIRNAYNLAVGYDQSRPNEVANSTKRFTIRANNIFKLLNDKLQVNTDVSLNTSATQNNNANRYDRSVYPYEQIADGQGNPASVFVNNGLRAAYTDTAGQGRLLNWKYKPLAELHNKSNVSESDLSDIRVNTSLRYKILSSLALSANYQYFKSTVRGETINDLNSFQTRNLINRVTQINSDGSISYPFPMGAVYSSNNSSSKYNYGRVQLDFNQNINGKHELNGLLGYEVRSENTFLNSSTQYGYNKETATSVLRDNVTSFPFYYGFESIIFNDNPFAQVGTKNNYLSYYSNFSYTYDRRYVAYASYRKDESNLFGVKSNQKGTPLWSSGIAWNISNEDFYRLDLFKTLKLRASYGYSGNVNQSLSAYTTATPSYFVNFYNSQYLSISNPPNPSLRWERVRNVNVGLDFELRKSVLTGTMEVYSKAGNDLIGRSPIASQTGIMEFTGNVANTNTNGFELQLNSRNFDRSFKWFTSAFINVAKDKVTNYMENTGTNLSIVSSQSITPLVGYPIRSVFSFRSAQLDTLGNPQGFIDGQLSNDYTTIINSNSFGELVYSGSAVPTIYGAVRNTFTYKNIELSANIGYKLGYFFRHPTLDNILLYNGGYHVAEYADRWQKPGDELLTHIPALVYPSDNSRNAFYGYSQTTVSKGDHIRLNDISINYVVSQTILKKMKLKSLNIYGYANNLGIIWRSNNKGIDPEVEQYPMTKTFSFGLKTTF